MWKCRIQKFVFSAKLLSIKRNSSLGRAIYWKSRIIHSSSVLHKQANQTSRCPLIRPTFCFLADGNCFFRAVAKEMNQTEETHGQWRQNVCKEIEDNPCVYQKCIEGGRAGVVKHVRVMRKEKKWASTCEMYAFAQVTKRPLYMFSPLAPDNAEDGWLYRWLIFQPRTPVAASQHPRYVTLCNTHGNHFDRVRPIGVDRCNCDLPSPLLKGRVATVDLTLHYWNISILWSDASAVGLPGALSV